MAVCARCGSAGADEAAYCATCGAPMAAPLPPPPPPPGGAARPPLVGPVEHPQGTTVLVLGILSLVVCGLLGPFAWHMGNRALADIDADPAAYSNRGNVVAGRVCGIISSVLLLLGLGLVFLFLLAALANSF